MLKINFSLKFLPLATLLFFSNSYADSFEVTSDILYFNYREFNTSGSLLDKETGFIPGVGFKYSTKYKNSDVTAYISHHDGQIDYAGKTQSGRAHTTRTNQILIKYGILLTSQETPDFPARLLFSFAYHTWDRDILSTTNVQGLHEFYSWHEFSLGLRFQGETIDDSFYWTNISALLIYNPEIVVFLDTGDKSLNIGENLGFRLHAGKTWQIENRHSISLSFKSEYFEFERSNTIFVNSFFGRSVFITEPDSASFHNSFNLTLSYRF